VAYVVPSAGEVIDPSVLRQQLSETLPHYMVPAVVTVLPRFPVTASGKLDRKALPRPDVAAQRAPYHAPRTRAEEILCALLAELLRVESVGVDDGFFALGGDSIVSIQLVTRARAAGLLFTPRDVFQHVTVGALAAVAQLVGVDQQSEDD